jgi:hypothetical protein
LFTVEDFECAVDPRHSTADEYLERGPPSAARSGGHRMEGIYIATGAGVRKGDGQQASIFDIAPTMLYAAGEPIPEVMDGEPLTELFTSEFKDGRPVNRESRTDLVASTGTDVERDSEDVQERLEDLGYI